MLFPINCVSHVSCCVSSKTYLHLKENNCKMHYNNGVQKKYTQRFCNLLLFAISYFEMFNGINWGKIEILFTQNTLKKLLFLGYCNQIKYDAFQAK